MAVATVVAAVLLGGIPCLLLLVLLAVLVPTLAAGESRAVMRAAVLLSLPLIVSVAIINVFLFGTGEAVLFELGPVTATAEGAQLAAEVIVRVLAMAGAVTLFYRTTRPGELVLDLERRGVSSRLTFVIHNAIAMVPRLATRAAEVTAAQRARGLETEGGVLDRLRGVIAITAPTVIGAIEEGEARTMALEARGFSRPGRRTLLWHPPDSDLQRAARWTITGAVALLAAARLVGISLPC